MARARHQRVATYSVSICSSSWTAAELGAAHVRAIPKSQIRRSQFRSTSRFDGLRSRWTTLHAWRWARPESSWNIKYWMWSSESSCPDEIT